MASKLLSLFTASILSLGASPAWACSQPAGPSERILDVTNYAPKAGGINGNCGKSATPGVDACKHLLEDYLSGKTKFVITAVPQREYETGRTKKNKEYRSLAKQYSGQQYSLSANMYGAYYRAVTLEKNLTKELGRKVPCVVVGAVDRYAQASNGLSKMDIGTVEAYPRTKKKVNREVAAVGASNYGEFIPLGRFESLKVPASRIKRDVKAMTPYQPADSALVAEAAKTGQVAQYSPYANSTSEDFDAYEAAQAAAKAKRPPSRWEGVTSEDFDAYEAQQAAAKAQNKRSPKGDRLVRQPASGFDPARFGD